MCIKTMKNINSFQFFFLYYDNFTVTQIVICSKMASELFIKILY